jgi:glycosyltransferase involved in cell wall biosynthesis
MKSSKQITIVTVNYNTSDFIELMLHSIHRLTENKYPTIICDNGSDNASTLKLVELERKHSNLEIIFRNQSQAGSIGHAEAVDLLVSKVETPYFLLMDADCCIFKKNWDQVLLKQLGDTVKVVGTPRLLQNGQSLDDFPTVFSTLYETKSFNQLDCSFMPGPGGAAANQDTGYLIAEKFRESGFGFKNLIAKNTRHYQQGPFGDILCAEYYLDKECKELFSCHFSRGSSNGKDKYRDGLLLKLPIFKGVVRYFSGKRDRKKWINRAYQLINQA